ncbi:hypothetical protein E1287_34310 [Actinomadura sp. KC06]|uniref:hypothetical protein n=1 Tax=Actinomadura sp. KC06 TaxID=2530369 RepID=UPI001050B305|nr:hypothetical protein [Actinomadura sp. KC06]TDD27554.1 hypothetical protein E1287_34310 [Actinomadura sp. KC06]
MYEGLFGKAAQERAIAEVEAEMARLCELLAEGLGMGLDAGREMVGGAMSGFLAEFFDLLPGKGAGPGMDVAITLPLLVHGVETGEPGPARPIAVIHLLWWAAARRLDDLGNDLSGAPGGQALTALAVGGHLPARLVADLPVTGAVRAALHDELSRAWLDAVDARLRDLAEEPSAATPESVLRRYEGRTGAPYGMAAASAARLAGAGPRCAGWRAFGRTLGVLRMLADDQRDLASGRCEHLAAGTATYLLAHLLDSLPARRREEVLDLFAAARVPGAGTGQGSARAELAARMLDDDVLDSYAAAVAPLVERAHSLVDVLGGDPGCVRELHGLVDETAGGTPGFRLAVA